MWLTGVLNFIHSTKHSYYNLFIPMYNYKRVLYIISNNIKYIIIIIIIIYEYVNRV